MTGRGTEVVVLLPESANHPALLLTQPSLCIHSGEHTLGTKHTGRGEGGVGVAGVGVGVDKINRYHHGACIMEKDAQT